MLCNKWILLLCHVGRLSYATIWATSKRCITLVSIQHQLPKHLHHKTQQHPTNPSHKPYIQHISHLKRSALKPRFIELTVGGAVTGCWCSQYFGNLEQCQTQGGPYETTDWFAAAGWWRAAQWDRGIVCWAGDVQEKHV